MLRYPTYMAVETLTIALVTEDGQSFEDLGIEERKEGQVIIKCRKAEPMGDGAPCEWNKMGSDGYPLCASSTEVMRLREQSAKLRELVHMMLRVAGIAEYATDAEWQVIARYLSKLGIEVEG